MKQKKILTTNKTLLLIWAAFFVAIGVLLPMIFHFFGGLGKMLLPMHIPVLLCGFVCGPSYGALCGFIVPILSASLTGMPVMFPNGVIMAFELLTYGFLGGILYQKGQRLLIALIAAMVAGRIVSGLLSTFLYGFAGLQYGFETFITVSFVVAFPGSIIQ